MCGLFPNHVYGIRNIVDGWHCGYAGQLAHELGFEAGDAPACVVYNREKISDVRFMDDTTTGGSKVDFDWFKEELSKRYELQQPRRLGPGAKNDKEAVVLNRIVRWISDDLEYEADPRQGDKLLRDFNLDGDDVKATRTPWSQSY